MSLLFIRTSVNSEDARTLLNELNTVLTGILGHNGMAHVCFDDFSREKGFFLVGYEAGIPETVLQPSTSCRQLLRQTGSGSHIRDRRYIHPRDGPWKDSVASGKPGLPAA